MVSTGALSLAQTPPLVVPLRYMLTAPLFAIAASILILVYPEALQNRWSPVMLCGTHMLVLGFSAMVMFGAIQQVIPVLAGVTLPRPRLTSLILYIGLVAGISCLCAGLLLNAPSLMFAALIFLSLTVASFFAVVMLSLLRSEANLDSILGIRLAVLSFLISAAVGLYLTAGHGLAAVPLARNLTPLHLAWGLVGWIGLLVIAVSYQVVPMFQITPRYPKAIVRWLAPVIFASLVVWSLFEFILFKELAGNWLRFLPQAGVLAGLLTFCGVTLWLQHKRRRKLPDVTLDYFRVAVVCMILGICSWVVPTSWFSDQFHRPVLTGALMIVGFAMSVISGMLYKIVPFLIWLHLTNQIDMSERWRQGIPNMKQIISPVHSRRQFRLHVACLAALVTAIYLGQPVIQLAAMLLLVSSCYLLGNLVLALGTYRRVLLDQQ